MTQYLFNTPGIFLIKQFFVSLEKWDFHHESATRHRNDFEITHAKKDLNKNKFFNKSLTDYNNILTLETGRKLRNTGENEKLFNVKDSIITFKKKLRNYLLQIRNWWKGLSTFYFLFIYSTFHKKNKIFFYTLFFLPFRTHTLSSIFGILYNFSTKIVGGYNVNHLVTNITMPL